MDPEERQKKLDAGRAKLAHFRQRKAKGDGTHPPKKTAKRKGVAVHSDDLPAQECPLVTEELSTDCVQRRESSRASETHGEFSSSSTVGDPHTEEELNSAMEPAQLEVQEYKLRIMDLEERLLGKQSAVDQLGVEVEQLREKLAAQTGGGQLQELETAVQNRNEIITQLSANLQQAIQSREEVQLEALQLTEQIQALKLQLQQASDFLRLKSHNCAELVQAQQQISAFQHSLNDQISQLDALQQELEESQQNARDQQNLIAQKENVITELQQKLSITGDTVSQLHSALSLKDEEMSVLRNEMLALSSHHEAQPAGEDGESHENVHSQLHRLKLELEEAHKASQGQIKEFERERKEMEKQLLRYREDLRIAEEQAREALHFKAEKEMLNSEIVKLSAVVQDLEGKLLEEEEARQQLKVKYETDISKYDLQLQTLVLEKEMALVQMAETNDNALKHLRDEHEEEVQRLRQQLEGQHGPSVDCYRRNIEDLKENLNRIKARKDQENQETASESQDFLGLDFSLPQDQGGHLMEKYLSSAAPRESSWSEDCVKEQSLDDHSEKYRFELDSEILHDQTKSMVSVQGYLDCSEDLTGISLSIEDIDNRAKPGNKPLSSVQLEKYTSALQELDESTEAIDLEKALLIQQCKDLTEVLDDKTKQLEALHVEANRSSNEVQEVLEKWMKVTEELADLHSALEAEKQQRLQCEERIREKSQGEENLRNKLSLLESQLEHQEKNNANTVVKDSSFTIGMKELMKELKEENELLVIQLREQEQLVKDVQEQKLAGDSVTSEVQTLFGRQLSALQTQRDQLQAQLDAQKAKNQTTSELLGQKTLEQETLQGQLRQLKEREQSLQKIEEENKELESRLLCVEQNLSNADEALSQSTREKADLEERLSQYDIKLKNMENTLASEQEAWSHDLQKFEVERKKAEVEYLQKESALETQLADLKKSMADLERAHAEAVECLLHQESDKLEKAVKESEDQLRSSYKEEKCRLEERHQTEMKQLNAEMEKRLSDLKAGLEEEQKKQIGLIKQVHEREHEREMARLVSTQKQELVCLRAELNAEQQELFDELRERMDVAQQAELHQAQMEMNLELEALRLSLTNLHTAQLELSQSNLQREKEAALSELQESLNNKRAQECAMLQTRMQFELERLREQHWEQAQLTARQHQQEIDELKHAWETEVSEQKAHMEEEQASKIEGLKLEWEQESQRRLEELQQRLTEKQTELQGSRHQELQRLEEELSRARTDREKATRALEELEASHRDVLQDLEDRLSREHALQLQELGTKTSQTEQQMEKLQAEYDELKSHSEQEVAHLWSQLENMRTSRQELGELKEQLLARSSHVEELERLKQEFNQQRRELQAHNERELENLRTYFEQRLRKAEDSYQEEITLLQLRLEQGPKEDSVLETGDVSYLSEGRLDEGRSDLLGEITQKLEKHKEELDSLRLQLEERHKQELENLRSCLSLQYREDLLQVKTDLTDRYFSEIQDLKTKHSLELEQLRAKLSDNHIKEITKLRLQSAQEAARQVEAEVAERVRTLEEEHSARLAQLRSESDQIHQLQTQIGLLKEEQAARVKRIKEKHEEHQNLAEEQLKQDFLEDLRVKVEDARKEEVERLLSQLSQQKQEEMDHLRKELQAQAEERLMSLREELGCQAKEEREAARQELQDREQEIKCLEEKLRQEQGRLQHLQDSLETEQNPQMLAVRQKIQAQYDSELSTAKATMAQELRELNAALQEQADARLQEARARFNEEQEQLMEKFLLQQEAAVNELKIKHAEELQAQKSNLEQSFSKQQEDLEKEYEQLQQASVQALERDLNESHLVQLEVLEAELQAKHKLERDELETRMLSNMDTLESTYLAEIQSIRDERERALQDLKASFSERQEQQEKSHTMELERLRAEHQAQLKCAAEELRKELAQVHMVKFKAMAAELEEAQKEELAATLSSQRSGLEGEQCRALQALREEVLAMEEQHSKVLQELGELHHSEAHRREEELTQQLARDIDTLKAQHEEQLRELSTASARDLQELRRQMKEQASRQRLGFQEEMELLKCQSEMLLEQEIAQLKEEFEAQKSSALECQALSLEQKHERTDAIHREERDQLTAQLQEQAAGLAKLREEVAVLQKEMENKNSELETLLQRRERENEEGGNLVAMLRADLTSVTEERKALQDAHERVLKVLLEVVRSTIATEDLISRRIGLCMDSGLDLPQDSHRTEPGQSLQGITERGEAEAGPDSSLWSAQSDEGCELSQRLSESLFCGPELQPDSEEGILRVCHRLHSAVEKLLELVTESTRQLEQTQGVQAHLEQQFSRGRQDTAQLVTHHHRLLEQMDQQAGFKNQLELELHKAEGLIEGYVAEKAALEEALQQKESTEQRLVEELEALRGKLAELGEEHSLLLRQREAIVADMGDSQKGLLEEAERLAKEKLDVQRQAEKDRSSLGSRLKLVEAELEEQMSRSQELEDKRRVQTDDLQQHIQALEKQLRNNRHFIDEQAVEREHERDEFQQEIKKLEAQLRLPAKAHTGGDNQGQKIEDLVFQVQSLQATIKKKMEDYNVLLLSKEQYEREVTELNEEIDKMAARIRELEQAVLSNSEAEKRVSQLEQEVQRRKKTEEDLVQDKEALQQQQYANRIQISALQSKLDETRHRFPESTLDQALKDQLEAGHEALLSKEKRIEDLTDQLEHLQRDLATKSEEVHRISIQLEFQTNQSSACISQLQDEIIQLKETLSSLRRRQGVDLQDDEASMLLFPQALLEEKNQEIDHLNEQIMRLQQEVDNSQDNKVLEEKQAEIEELKSQIEHLQGDQERMRHDKEQEVEQLHEVIEKLQEELAQLGPNRHEVSDSQGSPEPQDFWQNHSQEDSLGHELASHSLQSSKARLKELEGQLHLASMEKDSIQKLLQTQEETFRAQVEGLGKTLQVERRQLEGLQDECSLLRAHLSQRQAEVDLLAGRVQELEDILREREAQLVETELQLKTAEERRAGVVADLGHLPEKVAELENELRQRQAEAEELGNVKREKSHLDSQLHKLQEQEVQSRESAETLQVEVQKLQTQVNEGFTEIQTLVTVKTELYAECQALRQRERCLQEEIERLRNEITSKSSEVQELKSQLEDKSARSSEVQTEVLTCAEETLAKAESALRQKEEQLGQLKQEHEALRAELAVLKEGLSSSTERAEKLQEEGQTKDRAVAELEVDNQRLKSKLQGLQADLAMQEEELAFQQRELHQMKEHYSSQAFSSAGEDNLDCHSSDRPSPEKHQDYVSSLSGESSLSSPEVLRKYDASVERATGFHSSHFSELSTLHSTGLDLLHSKASPLQQDCSQPPEHLPPDTDHPSICSPGSPSASDGNFSLLDSIEAEKLKELDDLESMPSPSPVCAASAVSVQEWASDGYGSNASSELGARLKLELETTERLDANFVEYLQQRGMTLPENMDSVADGTVRPEQQISPELQGLLRKVYEESCRVLALSERPFPTSVTVYQQPLPAGPHSWHKEKQSLHETIHSLKELLSKMIDKEEKHGDGLDWRRELLQAVRSVFDSERDWLRSELHAMIVSKGPEDMSPFVERLERLLKDQQQQQSLQRLLSADRSSLLAEVHNLQAQLHICSLQSQEQLQQLHGTLSSTEEQGSQRQHQLHRQVELLEYKLQQERTLVGDLQNSLTAEQTRSSEWRAHLRTEQEAVTELKKELAKSSQELQRASKAQQELQNEIRKLRCKLESVEAEQSTCTEALEKEQHRAQELQAELDQERLHLRHRQDQEGQTHEVLRLSLEERNLQNSQLCSALEQERTTCSNLRKELQIEQSRCEALISQERSRLKELEWQLEQERSRCAELQDRLAQEQQRLLDEFGQKLKDESQGREGAASQDRTFIQELQAQLEQERARGLELAAMMENTQQQVIHAKRQLEAEAQQSRDSLQREQEASAKLRTTLDSLQSQRMEAGHSLEVERQRANQQQAELEELREKIQALKEKERVREEQRERQRRQDRQELAERERRNERTNEKLHEVELQRLRDQQRIRQLQQTLAELEEQEREKTFQKCKQSHLPPPMEMDAAQLHHQQLQFTQQQLQLAMLRLKDFIHSSRDGTSKGRLCDDDDLRYLLRTLTGLDRDLQQLCSSTQRPSQASSSLPDRLLRENADLTSRLTALTEEKVDLKRSIARLEKEVQTQHRAAREEMSTPELHNATLSSEKLAWQKERAFLQAALRKAESELSRVTAEIENRPVVDITGNKFQRLYGKYLRAESFRKALVYQKKYLLLLLGGFQDCEQATLSLIARMGVYPSPGDLQESALRSRPINKFRSAVRVVIAISRLRFLVRKWQKATRKGQSTAVIVNGAGNDPAVRSEVLRPQHPGVISNSPPTRDVTISSRNVFTHVVHSPKSPFLSHNSPRSYPSAMVRSSERSLTPSQDPERTLTQYIQHLETIQQRLGGLQPGSPAGLFYSRKSDR
ncbi:pericentrin isoform X2 [Amia ocellicauda]|uniref:pericentrin isoform X2 n=1 Tax=Amia ocellicauda TaxID=2972642 RepID=UPI00346428B4